MKRFLVVYSGSGGIAELYNVGIFKAESVTVAREKARDSWGTTAELYACDLDKCQDGWSFFI